VVVVKKMTQKRGGGNKVPFDDYYEKDKHEKRGEHSSIQWLM